MNIEKAIRNLKFFSKQLTAVCVLQKTIFGEVKNLKNKF